MLSKSVCCGDNGGILSDSGDVGVDFGGAVIVAAERPTDEFDQLIIRKCMYSLA